MAFQTANKNNVNGSTKLSSKSSDCNGSIHRHHRQINGHNNGGVLTDETSSSDDSTERNRNGRINSDDDPRTPTTPMKKRRNNIGMRRVSPTSSPRGSTKRLLCSSSSAALTRTVFITVIVVVVVVSTIIESRWFVFYYRDQNQLYNYNEVPSVTDQDELLESRNLDTDYDDYFYNSNSVIENAKAADSAAANAIDQNELRQSQNGLFSFIYDRFLYKQNTSQIDQDATDRLSTLNTEMNPLQKSLPSKEEEKEQLKWYIPSLIEHYSYDHFDRLQYDSSASNTNTVSSNFTLKRNSHEFCRHWKNRFSSQSDSAHHDGNIKNNSGYSNQLELYRTTLETYISQSKRFYGNKRKTKMKRQQLQEDLKQQQQQQHLIRDRRTFQQQRVTSTKKFSNAVKSSTPIINEYPNDIRTILTKLNNNLNEVNQKSFCKSAYFSILNDDDDLYESNEAEYNSVGNRLQEMIEKFRSSKTISFGNDKKIKKLFSRFRGKEATEKFKIKFQNNTAYVNGTNATTLASVKRQPKSILSYSRRAGYMEPVILPFIHPSVCFSDNLSSSSADGTMASAKLLPSSSSSKNVKNLNFLVHDFGAFCQQINIDSKMILIDFGRRNGVRMSPESTTNIASTVANDRAASDEEVLIGANYFDNGISEVDGDRSKDLSKEADESVNRPLSRGRRRLKSQHDIETERKYIEEVQKLKQYKQQDQQLFSHSPIHLADFYRRHGIYFDSILLLEDPPATVNDSAGTELQSEQRNNLIRQVLPDCMHDTLDWKTYSEIDNNLKNLDDDNHSLLYELLVLNGNYTPNDFVVIKIDLDDTPFDAAEATKTTTLEATKIERRKEKNPTKTRDLTNKVNSNTENRRNIENNYTRKTMETKRVLVEKRSDGRPDDERRRTMTSKNTKREEDRSVGRVNEGQRTRIVQRRLLSSREVAIDEKSRETLSQESSAENVGKIDHDDILKRSDNKNFDEFHLLRDILADERIYSIIDVLYVDHHKLLHRNRNSGIDNDDDDDSYNADSPSTKELIQILMQLREKGIAAHAWV